MMQIPADMHKWRTKFAWEMIAYAVVMLLMAGFALSAAWFFRTKFLSNPAKMLFLTVSLAFVAAALVYSAIMCVQVSLSTRKHDLKMKELEKQRLPMTLERLREDLQPENQEQFRATTLKMLQSSSPVMKASVETSVGQLVEKVRKDVGSTPETEAELAKLEALVKDVLHQASMTVS